MKIVKQQIDCVPEGEMVRMEQYNFVIYVSLCLCVSLSLCLSLSAFENPVAQTSIRTNCEVNINRFHFYMNMLIMIPFSTPSDKHN